MEPKLSAVLPIKVQAGGGGSDLERAEMLLESLCSFALGPVFEKFYVVAVGDELPAIKGALARYTSLDIVFWDENELVPEFQAHPTVGGWTRQQAIKLAVSRVVDTAYYITFDCDVLCTRSFQVDTLLPGGKALLQLGPKQICPHWWTSSARMLRVDPRMEEPGMQVTPAILSVQICRKLLEELDRLGAPETALNYLMKPLDRWAWQRLMPGYKTKFRWTEYSLYYLFARSRNLLEEHHVVCGSEAYPRLLIGDHGVWLTGDFQSWQPERAFAPENPGIFCVIQSNTGISPAQVRDQVTRFFRKGEPNEGGLGVPA